MTIAQVIGGLGGAFVGFALAYGLAVRPLDVKLEASSVSLDTMGSEDQMQALVVEREFLDGVDHVELFPVGHDDPERLSVIPRGPLGGRVALGPIGCGVLRFEGGRAKDGTTWCVSLHVAATPPATACQVTVRGLAGASERELDLVSGDRLDFVLKSGDAAAPAPASLEILGATRTSTLTAALVGKIDGLSEAHACEWGRHVSFAGSGLELAWLVARIGPNVPRLEVWARARWPTRFDVDGSSCVVALYVPKWLWPALLIAGFAGVGWKVGAWRSSAKESASSREGRAA